MKRASGQYSIAMNKQLRDRGYAVAVIGIINLDAQQNASITSDILYLSGNTNPFSMNLASSPQYITFEENVFKMDGSQFIPPVNSEDTQLINNTAVLSENIMGAITITFKVNFDIKGLSIMFTEFFPTAFEISTNTGITRQYETDSSEFTTTDIFNGVTRLTITPLSFKNGDNKRLRIISILMGVGVMFTNTDISNMQFEESTSFVSEELPNRELRLNVLDPNNLFHVDNENSFLPYLQTGQEINSWIGQTLSDGRIEYIQMPLMYLTDWASDNHKASFVAKDRLALMTDDYTLGNRIYTRSLYTEAESILTDAGLEPDEYWIDDSLQDIIISAPMPIKTHAQCLQLIANAGRCALSQTSDGTIMLVANFENIVDPTDLTITSDTEAPWSKASNSRFGTAIEYSDLTQDYFRMDGSMFILGANNSDYLDTAYVSRQVADANGNFFNNLLPVPYFDTQPTTDIPIGDFTRAGVNVHSGEDGVLVLNGTATSDMLLVPYRAPSGNKVVEFGKTYRLASYGDELPTGCEFHFNYLSAQNVRLDDDIYIVTDDVYIDFIVPDVENWNKSIIYYQVYSGTVFDNTVLKPALICLDDFIDEPVGYVQGKAPQIELELPAVFSYFGLNLRFDGHYPREIKITTYREGQVRSTMTAYPDSNNYYLSKDFLNFDKMSLQFIKGAPNDRVVLNKIGFGTISDYYLKKNDMLKQPLGHLETKVKDVCVRVFSYSAPTKEGEAPKAIDDNVYEYYNVNSVGTTVKFENPIIDNAELAQEVAEWIGNYYANNVTYDVSYRGDPRIEGSDIIYMESDFYNNLQVEVESHSLQFNGALSGTLGLRRAINMTVGGE